MSAERDVPLRRRGEVSSRPLTDGAVLVNLRSGECFELNHVGFQIWNALDGDCDLERICDKLALIYPIDREQLAADVRALVAALLRAGLLEPSSTNAEAR